VLKLKLATEYPFDSTVKIEIETSQAREFALNLRIPSWTKDASIAVNGRRLPQTITPGTFATVSREWKNGDRLELDLPMSMRLEAIDPQHPKTVALMYGPLVLFAIADNPRGVKREDLLAAKRVDSRSWQVQSASGVIRMIPFTEIGDEQYATYLRTT